MAGTRLGRAWEAGRGWALAVVVACAVFVISNPHLYPNPAVHTAHLFDLRTRAMHQQQARAEESRISQNVIMRRLDRVEYLLRGSLVDGTFGGSRGVPVEAGLAPLGAAVLAVACWRGWRRRGLLPAEGYVLFAVFAYFIGISSFLALDWDRYLVPTLMIGTLLSGIGFSAAIRWLLSAQVKERVRVGAWTAIRP